MTRHEFIKQVEADKRAQYTVLLGLMGLFLVFGIVGSLVARRLPDRFDLGSPALWLLGSVACIVAIAALWLVRWSSRVGLTCPHCRKCLGNLSSQIVVATGRCGFCGESLIEEN